LGVSTAVRSSFPSGLSANTSVNAFGLKTGVGVTSLPYLPVLIPHVDNLPLPPILNPTRAVSGVNNALKSGIKSIGHLFHF
jgi:hypothetical protein